MNKKKINIQETRRREEEEIFEIIETKTAKDEIRTSFFENVSLHDR